MVASQLARLEDSRLRRMAIGVLMDYEAYPGSVVLEDVKAFGDLGFDQSTDADESKILAFWCDGFRRGVTWACKQQAKLPAEDEA